MAAIRKPATQRRPAGKARKSVNGRRPKSNRPPLTRAKPSTNRPVELAEAVVEPVDAEASEYPFNNVPLDETPAPRSKRKIRAAKPKTKTRRRVRMAAAEPEPTPFEDTGLAPEPAAGEDGPDASLRRQFIAEVEALVERLRAISPAYWSSLSPERVLEALEASTDFIPKSIRRTLTDRLKDIIGEDVFDVDTWKGMAYVVNSSIQMQADALKRRMTGEYETDKWGLDREYLDAVLPFMVFMYKKYWRVTMSGLENVPEEGRALLVANHSGQLPFDGAMLGTGIFTEHPERRMTRTLYATWFPTLPFISDFLTKCGQVLATEDNGMRLLQDDELVAVFPEGYKGVGKLFKDRYKLARFGRGGFVRMALKTGAPLIPVSIVGAEETYISLAKSNTLAKLTGFPYFPISPTFPWLGLLGFVPLPTKWYIDIGEPISTEKYGAKGATNLMLVSQLTDQVRNIVQDMIYARLAKRRSVFMG